MARQETMSGVVPPLTIAQEAALLYVEAEEEAKRAKDRANKRKDEMMTAAARLGVDIIKVRDSFNYLHVYTIDNKTTLRHSKALDVVIEKAADDLKA